jgi:ABC-type transport system substrate-binding protein
MKAFLNKKAITRMQGILIIAVLIVIAGVGIYATLPPSGPGPTGPTSTTTVPLTTKAGKGRLVVDLWYESSGHYPQSADQAVVYKAQLERSGIITVNLHGVDWAGFKAARNSEAMPVYIYGWYPDYLDPDDYMYPIVHSVGGAWMHLNWKNPEIDRLIEQGRAVLDTNARAEIYAKIQKLMVDDAVFVPIVQFNSWAFSKPDVKGIVLDITQNMDYWLIESPRDQLIVGTTDSIEASLDPAEGYTYFDNNVMQNVGAGLVYIKPGSPAGPNDFEPGLATSWSASSDGLAWTFNLRQGVKFSDGKEFDADSVKYSFDRSMGLAMPDGAQVGIGYMDIIDKVEVTSKYQVVFHLKFPFSPFLSLMAFQPSFIVNPKYAPMDKAVYYVEGNARASNPNDLGPYLLTSWDRRGGKEYELRFDVNPNYWGLKDGYPKTKHVIFRFYADSTALALAMQSGDVDMAYRHITSTDTKSFMTNPNVKVWQGPGTAIQWLCFNVKDPRYADPKVRQAIAAALDRKEVVNTVFLGLAKPLYSMIPDGMAFHEDAFKTLGDANITLTVSILQELGYG